MVKANRNRKPLSTGIPSPFTWYRFKSFPNFFKSWHTQKIISVLTLVKKNTRDCSRLDPQGLKRSIFYSQSMGTCGLKDQIYEHLNGKMLTSTKITSIPWNALRIPELRSQKSLWSLSCQYSRRGSLSHLTFFRRLRPHSKKTMTPVSQQVKLTWEGQTDLPGYPRPELYS